MRFVVHRAAKHELSWCVPGFTARPTLEAALALANERSAQAKRPMYVHERRDDGYRAVAHVEFGHVRLLAAAAN